MKKPYDNPRHLGFARGLRRLRDCLACTGLLFAGLAEWPGWPLRGLAKGIDSRAAAAEPTRDAPSVKSDSQPARYSAVVELEEGGEQVGRVIGFDDHFLTLAGTERTWQLPWEGVAGLRSTASSASSPATAAASLLELVDGSLLRGELVSLDDREATWRAWGAEHRLPARVIRSVYLEAKYPPDPEWQRLQAGEMSADRLVIRQSGQLDFVDGVVGDVQAAHVSFTTEGEKVEVRRGKVAGIVFHRRRGDVAAAAKWGTLALEDGSTIAVRRAALHDARLSFEAVCGWQAVIDANSLCRLDVQAAAAQYLSDLEPIRQDWRSYFPAPTVGTLTSLYLPRRDQTFSGSALVLAGRSFSKGLALHSRTELAYRVPDDCSRFRALAGLDPTVAAGGSVRLVISADDQPIADHLLRSGEEPLAIDLDIQGKRQLQLLVDFADNLDFGDHLLLARARFTP